MDAQTQVIYDRIFDNAVMFLRRAIKELIVHQKDHLEHEQAVVACIFMQMAIELGLKSYLIRTKSVFDILEDKYKNKSISYIANAFQNGTLKTKNFDELKNKVIVEDKLFNTTQKYYLSQFQRYRNQAVHFDLKLHNSDLYDLKYDLIYVLVHIIIAILTEMNMDFESPSEFFNNHLDKADYMTLISYRPYVEEMEKVARQHARLVYKCIECGERTYSVDNEMCYCCNLQFEGFGEYVSCISCEKPRSMIFDHLNIASNDNIMDGLCLNCDERCQVFKCPTCDYTIPFFSKNELKGTCYTKCDM